MPSAPTCPLALAGEAPAASSAVTSPRGALELWLPMMGGFAGGRPEPPRARAAGDSSTGSAWPVEGWGSRLRGRGMGGETELHPLSTPDQLAVLAAVLLRARMPPAARRAAYIYAPRARGGAGHLNERPIEGRRRAQVSGPHLRSGLWSPNPYNYGVWCGNERGEFFGELGGGELLEERREYHHSLLSQPTSQRDTPAVAPTALVLN